MDYSLATTASGPILTAPTRNPRRGEFFLSAVSPSHTACSSPTIDFFFNLLLIPRFFLSEVQPKAQSEIVPQNELLELKIKNKMLRNSNGDPVQTFILNLSILILNYPFI